jgi:hypothetical protein
LDKRDEEYDCAQNTGKEPVLVDGIRIEKEGGADRGFLQEVGGEES